MSELPPSAHALQERRDLFELYAASVAENYQRFFVPSIGIPHAHQTLGIAALQPGERVLDIACGTGVVTRMAARRVGEAGSVTGLEVDPEMISVARDVTPDVLPIEWVTSSAEQLLLADAQFDVVICQLGLQFLRDRAAAVREMYRVLKPNGRLVLSVAGKATEPFQTLDQETERYFGIEAGEYVRRVFSLVEPQEIETLLRDAGFRDVGAKEAPLDLILSHPEEFLWQYVHSTPLARHAAVAGEQARIALEEAVLRRWQPFVDQGVLKVRITPIVASARK